MTRFLRLFASLALLLARRVTRFDFRVRFSNFHFLDLWASSLPV